MISLGIDSGTQSTKTIALDLDSGKILAAAAHSYGFIEGLPPGHLEQEPHQWIESVDLTVRAVLEKLGRTNNPLFELALKLEEIALKDDYFISRKLYPNVDFYSGITMNALGFPADMFTVLFAMSRTVGWIAQWAEMISDPSQKIGRPRQIYTGPTERQFVPLDERV